MRGRLLLLLGLIAFVALAAPSTAFAHGIHGEAETIAEFIRLGIRHMVGGWDHLLFIAGIVLLAANTVRAAKLVSLFVAGHSLTLLVATLAGWQLDPEVVDVVIALSLAYVGWRILVGRPRVWSGTQLAVFGFGLVHGLGLSSRLQEQPLPGGARLVADILAFNLGVEIGQLAALSVIVMAGLLVKRYAGQLLPPVRYAGIGFAAVGVAAAAVLSFSAARPADEDDTVAASTAPAAAETQPQNDPQGEVAAGCVQSQQTPVFDGEASFGGHPRPFHSPDEPANPSDLAHVVGDGYVIVQYNRGMSQPDRDALEQWAYAKQGVVVTPTPGPIDAAFSAQTARLNFTCEALNLDALTDFHARWFSGTAG
jgi:hydrogenase/urease accessory protein HupE